MIQKTNNQYTLGRGLETIEQEILDICIDNNDCNNKRLSDLYSLNTVSNRITYRLVNLEMNRERLKEIPHLYIEDMAKIYAIVVSDKSEGISTIVITNDLLNIWRVDIEYNRTRR